jgi:hypothetical protein
VKRVWECKEEVWREEGMGEADGVIAGYSWRVCARVCVCVSVCVFVLLRACKCSIAFDVVLDCLYMTVRVRSCVPVFVEAASRTAATHAACRPSSAISVDVTAPDTPRRRMMLQPAMRASAGAQPVLRVTDAPPSRPPPVLRRPPE